MAGRSRDTYKKRQKEVARAEKQREKAARRMERKQQKRTPELGGEGLGTEELGTAQGIAEENPDEASVQ